MQINTHILSKEVVDELAPFLKIKTCVKNGVELAKINYHTMNPTDFIAYPILKYLRGSVYVVERTYYSKIYSAMNKFEYLPKTFFKDNLGDETVFDCCIEKLDGMMILPYIYNNQIFWSSRWAFDTEPTVLALKYATQDYYNFIMECKKNSIYLTFELISPQSFIKTLYPPERYGLYLVAAQHFNGTVYPLYEKSNGYVYVNNGTNEVKVPKSIQTPILYDIHTINELNTLLNKFEAREFEGVIAYVNNCPYKVKTENYIKSNGGRTQLYIDMANSVIDGTYDKYPDVKLIHRMQILYEDIQTLELSFRDIIKKYKSKKAITADIKGLPPYFNALYYLFEKREDKFKATLYRYYIDRIIEILNIDSDIELDSYQVYM